MEGQTDSGDHGTFKQTPCETSFEASPTMLTISDDALRKMFYEAKSNDLTQSQFEQEKTKRIAALCDALKAVAHCEQAGNYGQKSPRDEIMSQLSKACDSFYQPMITM